MRKAKKQTQLKSLAIAVSMIAIPLISFNSYAAGLGRITVQSALGQPLRAQLEIMASKDEASSAVAQLASPDAFRLAGIDYTAALTGLKFSRTIKEDGARKYIEVTTDRPLNEPFIDMLVELSWASGRLVREYTFLLDPPEVSPREVPVTSPAVSSLPGVAASIPAATTQEPKVPTAAPASRAPAMAGGSLGKVGTAANTTPAASSSSGREREVRFGDTLGQIAREVKPEGISLDQMLVALFRENPDAFEGNMNRMRAGKILRVPDAAAAEQMAPTEARNEVKAQASDWEAYRARVAARAAMAKGTDASMAQSTQGKVAPKVEDSGVMAKPGSDKLAVSRTESGKDGGTGQKARVGALEEDLVARDRALKDANSRIADLEKNLNDLKKLAELKSQAGANVQKMADATKTPPGVASKATSMEPPKPAEIAKALEVAKPVEPNKPAEVPVAQAAAQAPGTATPEASPVASVGDAPKPEATKPEGAQTPAPAPKPKPKPKVVPPPEPEPEPDFMEENGLLVASGGGILALLFGYLGFSAYRRKKAAAAEAPEAVAPLTEPSAAVNSVFSDTVGATVAPSTVDNVAQTSVLETVGNGTAASIDPLDEADTYLAFGKDSQAEEILLDALKTAPTRWAIHLKLLEIYSARRSANQFNTLAEELRAQTAATGEEWLRAAEMGRALDPNNPMYSSASEPAGLASATSPTAPVDMEATMVFSAPPVADPAPVAPEPPEEKAAVLDFDLGLDDGPTPADVPSAEAAKSSNTVSPLEFDLDLDAPSTPKPVTDAPVAAVPPAASAGLNIDFDLELPTPPKEEVTALSLDTELSLPESEPPVALPMDAPIQALSLDAPEVELPTEQQVVIAPPPVEAAPDFDFDLGEPPGQVAQSSVAPGEEVDLPLDPSENPEAATKLELALAYEEMGDRDGARELFQEVLAEGSPAQQATAQAKLDQLA